MKHIGKWISAALVLLALLVYLVYPSREELKNDLGAIFFPGQKNSYIAEEFYMEGEFLRYGGAKHLVGIDVSTHQGEIDWSAVAESGVEFAIIRAGYRGSSVGELYEDECFSYNYRKAKKAGLRVGVYFFSQAISEQEAVEEAQFLCKLLKGKKLDLPVFYDWEHLDGRVPSAAAVPMTSLAVAFCQ